MMEMSHQSYSGGAAETAAQEEKTQVTLFAGTCFHTRSDICIQTKNSDYRYSLLVVYNGNMLLLPTGNSNVATMSIKDVFEYLTVNKI